MSSLLQLYDELQISTRRCFEYLQYVRKFVTTALRRVANLDSSLIYLVPLFRELIQPRDLCAQIFKIPLFRELKLFHSPVW